MLHAESRMQLMEAFRSRMQVVFTIGSGAGTDHELVERHARRDF